MRDLDTGEIKLFILSFNMLIDKMARVWHTLLLCGLCLLSFFKMPIKSQMSARQAIHIMRLCKQTTGEPSVLTYQPNEIWMSRAALFHILTFSREKKASQFPV